MKIDKSNGFKKEISNEQLFQVIQAIMLDYEQLANSHNVLIKTLHNLGIINNEEIIKAANQLKSEKLKNKILEG